jgi:hypothetical protein
MFEGVAAESVEHDDGLIDYFIMEWIRIEDKLPPPFERVLVYFGGMGSDSVAVKYLTDRSHPDGSRAWYPGGQTLENGTHWMPLPPLPA